MELKYTNLDIEIVLVQDLNLVKPFFLKKLLELNSKMNPTKIFKLKCFNC